MQLTPSGGDPKRWIFCHADPLEPAPRLGLDRGDPNHGVKLEHEALWL